MLAGGNRITVSAYLMPPSLPLPERGSGNAISGSRQSDEARDRVAPTPPELRKRMDQDIGVISLDKLCVG